MNIFCTWVRFLKQLLPETGPWIFRFEEPDRFPEPVELSCRFQSFNEQNDSEENGTTCERYIELLGQKTSMDWFVRENLTRKPSIFPKKKGLSAFNFPLNQSIDNLDFIEFSHHPGGVNPVFWIGQISGFCEAGRATWVASFRHWSPKRILCTPVSPQKGNKLTLWLCQNSYWKLPFIDSGFSH